MQSLYGHYLLPNGKLAHFALGDTVRKGHKVRDEQKTGGKRTSVCWRVGRRGL